MALLSVPELRHSGCKTVTVALGYDKQLYMLAFDHRASFIAANYRRLIDAYTGVTSAR
jgi:hypothetical protein